MSDTIKNNSLRYPSRPNSIDVRSLSTDVFPYDAFEFDDPNLVDDPKVRLKDPWGFEVSDITVDRVIGGVQVLANKVVQLTTTAVVEVAGIVNSENLWYTVAGGGVYSKPRDIGAASTLISSKDLRQLFVTQDYRVGGISVGDSPGVYIGDVHYITDAVVDVAFIDWQNVYCVLNDDHKVYRYNVLTNDRTLVIDEVVQWIGRGCDDLLIYQTINGVYSFNGVTSTLMTEGVFFKGLSADSTLYLLGLDGMVYAWVGQLLDLGISAYNIDYCDGLIYVANGSHYAYVSLLNQYLEGVSLGGNQLTANFFGNTIDGSFIVTVSDLEQMKKVFVGDIISHPSMLNAEVVERGGNYVRTSVPASATLTNAEFSLTGTRLTLNANQVIIPGTITADEIQAGTITADKLTITPSEIGAVAETDVGALAYEDVITNGFISDATIDKAKLNTTIIDGGYLNTSLIEADSITAAMIDTANLAADTGFIDNLTVKELAVDSGIWNIDIGSTGIRALDNLGNNLHDLPNQPYTSSVFPGGGHYYPVKMTSALYTNTVSTNNFYAVTAQTGLNTNVKAVVLNVSATTSTYAGPVYLKFFPFGDTTNYVFTNSIPYVWAYSGSTYGTGSGSTVVVPCTGSGAFYVFPYLQGSIPGAATVSIYQAGYYI